MKLALLSLLFASMVPAVIVDGVAISVANKVITRSEILQRIRLTAFQNGVPADESKKAQREAAQKLIDWKLIEREMDLGRYPRGGREVGLDLLRALVKTEFNGSDDALKNKAAVYGLTPDELGDELTKQQDLLTFLGLRFRPAIQVSDADTRKYFDEKFAAKIPATEREANFSKARAQIEELLTTEAADREMETWLQDQRMRTRIDFIEKELLESTTK